MDLTKEACEFKLSEARRIVQLREEQMRAAALSRNAGDICSLDWDGYAARYAAAVREWWVWQQYMLEQRLPMAETQRDRTFVLVS